ncbi:Uncharacterised protein [Mycobacteroides abscessus subsp. abscessus]|nr:Uncharacterised protein [Mycobacteroides abscessus subsp. abscessus]
MTVDRLKIRTEYGSRPAISSSRRIVPTVSRRIALVGAAVKIASAFSAANRTPRGDDPAW